MSAGSARLPEPCSSLIRLQSAKDRLDARLLPILRPKMVPYRMHLYAERMEAPASRIGELILRVCGCAEKGGMMDLCCRRMCQRQPSVVCNAIGLQCADERDAALVVTAAHNRVCAGMALAWASYCIGVSSWADTQAPLLPPIAHSREERARRRLWAGAGYLCCSEGGSPNRSRPTQKFTLLAFPST